MSVATKKKKGSNKMYLGTLDTSIKNLGNDPYFVKKTEEARKFLKKVGLPKDFMKKKKK
jgi:hypothetical protein